MTIRSVESFLLSYAFPKPLEMPFYGGLRRILKRDAMLIRITSSNGLKGYAPGPASEAAQERIQRDLAPFLEGREIEHPQAIRRAFFAAANPATALAKLYAAVELALYDLAGRTIEQPVSELLGGRQRDTVKLYGSAGMYQSTESYAEEAAAIISMGFPAYKMRPAAGPEQDLEAVRQMRASMGSDAGLMLDTHAWWRMGDRSYSLENVRKFAKAAASYGLIWLEEPLPPADHDAYRTLNQEKFIPIASGEHEQSEQSFLNLVDCVDYVQADLICQGGYPTAARIFEALEKAGKRFAYHSWGNDLEVITAAHQAVCFPENVVEWLEYPCYANQGRPGMYPFPIAQDILAEPLEIEGGSLTVPDKPGFGVKVNEAVIERFPWIPGPWSYFHLDAPKTTLAVTSDHSVAWVEGQ